MHYKLIKVPDATQERIASESKRSEPTTTTKTQTHTLKWKEVMYSFVKPVCVP